MMAAAKVRYGRWGGGEPQLPIPTALVVLVVLLLDNGG
jgi:hypothetical protein